MASAAIVISQSGKPQAIPGMSRSDLSANTVVMLTNHDNTDVGSWTWELKSPKGSKTILQGAINPVATFKPDIPGSYMVKLSVGTPDGALTDTRIAAVGTPALGLRKPAAGEKGEFDNALGPWSAVHEAFDRIDAVLGCGLRNDGSNAPVADIPWGGHRITDLGGIEVEGALRLGRTEDPEPIDGKAFLYLKEVRGSLDLFYCSPDGSTVRITRDGRLNVPASFDDRIKLYPDDSKPGYLLSKVSVGIGLKTTEINGALWVEPVCGSEHGTLCAGDDPRLDREIVVPVAPAPVGVAQPAPNSLPLSDVSGTLDSWVSKAADRKPGLIALAGDLSGSADAPKVVGLHGKPVPQADGFLRWGESGSRIEIVPYGASGQSVCRGDDPRLSDSRPPCGEAGGQVSGPFSELRVSGVTEGGGVSLSMGEIPDGCALVRRGDAIVGVDPSERRAIAMAINEVAESENSETVGCFMLDGSQDASPMVFQGICRVTRSGLVGFVSLYNATNDKPVVEIRVGETAFAVKKTNAFKPLPGKRLYEVRIRLDGKSLQVGDKLVCMWAGLLTD